MKMSLSQRLTIQANASAHSANMAAHRLGLPGRLSDEDVFEMCRFTEWKCFYCGEVDSAFRETASGKVHQLCVDHLTALSLGGANTLENVVPCCRRCNSRKNNTPFLEWLTTNAIDPKVFHARFETMLTQVYKRRLERDGKRKRELEHLQFQLERVYSALENDDLQSARQLLSRQLKRLNNQ